jgi:hypothetical protein
MANTKKYVSLDKLSLYDEKIKKYLKDADDAALVSAKEYADGLAKNYEAAGAVETARVALQKNIDAVQANVDIAAAAAATAQSEVDALETLVGTLPAGTAAESVVAYVDLKTAGIATDAALGELNNQVSGLQTVVNGIVADHLKAADKQELADAIAAEASRADTAEKANAAAIKAIADDYLKAADKTELQGNIDKVAEDVAAIAGDYLKAADKTELEGKIALKADKTALDAVSAVANAAATQTALQAEIDRAKGEETRIEGLVTAEADRAAKAEADLQTQINTIMNNPDTEGVINSINEFTQYITEHGGIADGFRADIDANAKAIEDHEALAAQTYETKEDAAAKLAEAKEYVDTKVVQADWAETDESSDAYIKNKPVFGEETYVDIYSGVIAEEDLREFDMGNGKKRYYAESYGFGFEAGKEYCVVLNGESYQVVAKKGYYNSVGDENLQEYPFDIYANGACNFDTPGSKYLTVQQKAFQIYDDCLSSNIARVNDIYNASNELRDELNGEIAKKADASALTSAVEALDADIAELVAADEAMAERVAAVEALMGDGDGSVTDLIADAKAELQGELATAIADAKTDASNKDAVVLAEAQKAAAAVQTALDTHTNNADIHVTAADKVKWNAAADVTAKAHEHKNFEVLEGITAAKVTAWDAAEGNAKTYADGLNTAMDTRVTAIETWHANFVEVSEEEINGLFTA